MATPPKLVEINWNTYTISVWMKFKRHENFDPAKILRRSIFICYCLSWENFFCLYFCRLLCAAWSIMVSLSRLVGTFLFWTHTGFWLATILAFSKCSRIILSKISYSHFPAVIFRIWALRIWGSSPASPLFSEVPVGSILPACFRRFPAVCKDIVGPYRNVSGVLSTDTFNVSFVTPSGPGALLHGPNNRIWHRTRPKWDSFCACTKKTRNLLFFFCSYPKNDDSPQTRLDKCLKRKPHCTHCNTRYVP